MNLVGSRDVAINTSNDLDYECSITSELGNITLYAVLGFSDIISKDVLSLLLTNCGCGRQLDPCAVWDVVPEPPSAARHLSDPLESIFGST